MKYEDLMIALSFCYLLVSVGGNKYQDLVASMIKPSALYLL